tara:strand:+ start:1830 stop:2276 length:447 start_codon:yes stop_codon:yes gene_type:complete
MATSTKSFCVVCMANYCRSPVAENLLKKRFGKKYEFFSAGIAPISHPNMDKRSIKFLQENNVEFELHTPKKINEKMLKYFDYFLAVDFFVLNQLNITYPKYRHKFRSLSMQFKDINITDPYQLKIDDYMVVMEDIKHVTNKINLEEIL